MKSQVNGGADLILIYADDPAENAHLHGKDENITQYDIGKTVSKARARFVPPLFSYSYTQHRGSGTGLAM